MKPRGDVMCSWCHGMNSANGLALTPYCVFCGHRADRARAECDCPKCWKPVDGVAEPGTGSTTNAHTPGPWEAITDRRNKKDQELPPVVVTRCEGWRHGTPVAIMSASNKAAVYANARLIAAAPDLYEALKTVHPWFELWLPDDIGPAEKRLLEIVNGAIAKAEGREP